MNSSTNILQKCWLIVCLAILVSCRSENSQLVGLVRDQPLDVSAIYLPEETNSMKPTAFNTVAKSGELLILFFGYTNCPDLCPTTLSDIRAALAASAMTQRESRSRSSPLIPSVIRLNCLPTICRRLSIGFMF